MKKPTNPIRDWLLAVFALSANNMTREEIEARLATYVPMLEHEFPPAAYSRDSLAFVARQCKFAPSFAEVCEHLGEWWRENRPRPEQLAARDMPPPPPREPPTPEETAAVRELVQQFIANVRSPFAEPGRRTDAAE